MAPLASFRELIALEHGLCVVTTLRADHTPHATVVNAGVLAHPQSRDEVVGFVSAGNSLKLSYLRANPTIAVTVRAGWQWVTVEGSAQPVGPDDPLRGIDEEGLRILLRSVFSAAGGSHEDWETYDRVMRQERRTAVLVEPTRIYSNPG